MILPYWRPGGCRGSDRPFVAHTRFRELRCDAWTSPSGFYFPHRLGAARNLTVRILSAQSGIASASFLIHRCRVAVREAWARPKYAVRGVVGGATAGVFRVVAVANWRVTSSRDFRDGNGVMGFALQRYPRVALRANVMAIVTPRLISEMVAFNN